MRIRNILVCLLCLGILLPKATAALAIVLPADGQIITICTPSGIETIVLDSEGNPVEGQTVSSEPCLSAHVDLVPQTHSPDWHRVASQFDTTATLFSTPTRTEHTYFRRPPCRAPPLL